MRFTDTMNLDHSAIHAPLRQEKAFTFFEVMVTLVILSVGMTGIYRAFLTSLNYYERILTRIHILNVLSDEHARAENTLIQKTDFSFVSGTVILPGGSLPLFSIDRVVVPLPGNPKAIRGLQIKLRGSQEGRPREFTRGALVYVHEK